MKKAQTAIAKIEKLSHDGRGIARLDGKITFIQGALPQETVEFRYTRRKSDFDEGYVESVIEAAEGRVTPLCPHYGECGGCSLQHVSNELQIKAKEAALLELLERERITPSRLLPPLLGPIWNYRDKARLSVRFVEKKGSTLVGFREVRNPRYIANINGCSILNSNVDKIIPQLKHLIDNFDLPNSIAQIEVAAGDRVALIFRHLFPLSEKDIASLIAFSKAYSFQIYLQPGGVETVAPLLKEDSSLLEYSLPNHQIKFQFFPTDFTQINAHINAKMVDLALELLQLESHDIVCDLFCGLGNFSLPIAKYCRAVFGVEGSVSMVLRAKHNALLNQIQNAEFHSMNLEDEKAIKYLSRFQANKLLLDPPRAGALNLVHQIEKLKLSHIVYVSCNPATLARDAAVLCHKGYTLQSVGVMDMFPHTTHVESIALFKRNA